MNEKVTGDTYFNLLQTKLVIIRRVHGKLCLKLFLYISYRYTYFAERVCAPDINRVAFI